jgi:hypothetical protein
MGRTVPAVPLRDPPMARWLDPRCERRRRGSRPRRERDGSCAASPRSGAVRSHPRMGPRRAACGRHVELQLADLVAARTRRRGHPGPPPAIRRSSARLGRRSGRGATGDVTRALRCLTVASPRGGRARPRVDQRNDAQWTLPTRHPRPMKRLQIRLGEAGPGHPDARFSCSSATPDDAKVLKGIQGSGGARGSFPAGDPEEPLRVSHQMRL